MLLRHYLNKLQNLETLKRAFRPELASHIRRLQLVWLGCIGAVVLGLCYMVVGLLFKPHPPNTSPENLKSYPTSLETASHKVDLNAIWRHKVENDVKALSQDIASLKANDTQAKKDQSLIPEAQKVQDIEAKLLQLEDRLETLSRSKQEEGRLQPSLNQTSFSSQEFPPLGSSGSEGVSIGSGIQKFSLTLSENPTLKKSKTVETTIPAGAFAKTILLSGLDASSAMNASSDPRPMLLRIIDYGTLPRKFQSDLKDCHCTASAFGDLSSERVYARLEKLTCVVRLTGEIIETQVAGYIAGSDGKAGIRGIVASKDGQFLGRSLVGGIFAGLSNVANPGNRRGAANPFAPGGAGIPPISMGENFTSGMASGASSALDRLSQYYIDRAEQLQPVIQVASGQVVDIVFTEGTTFGSQTIKQDLEIARNSAKPQDSPSSLSPHQEGL